MFVNRYTKTPNKIKGLLCSRPKVKLVAAFNTKNSKLFFQIQEKTGFKIIFGLCRPDKIKQGFSNQLFTKEYSYILDSSPCLLTNVLRVYNNNLAAMKFKPPNCEEQNG